MNIELTKWSHGVGLRFLFDGDKYCALGFYLASIGISDDELLFNIYPHFLTDPQQLPKWLFASNEKGIKDYSRPGKMCSKIIEINDSDTQEKKKIKSIQQCFSQVGVDITLI